MIMSIGAMTNWQFKITDNENFGIIAKLPKYTTLHFDTSHSVRNLSFIFNEHLTFSYQITALSKACYYHIRPYCRESSQILSYDSDPRCLHWPRITERIECKLLSLTYKVLTTTQPLYLRNPISIQLPRSTRFSYVVTLTRPPSSSSLKITDRSFLFTLSLESVPFVSS